MSKSGKIVIGLTLLASAYWLGSRKSEVDPESTLNREPLGQSIEDTADSESEDFPKARVYSRKVMPRQVDPSSENAPSEDPQSNDNYDRAVKETTGHFEELPPGAVDPQGGEGGQGEMPSAAEQIGRNHLKQIESAGDPRIALQDTVQSMLTFTDSETRKILYNQFRARFPEMDAEFQDALRRDGVEVGASEAAPPDNGLVEGALPLDPENPTMLVPPEVPIE